MSLNAQNPDLNDKTVVKGQKGPNPYRLRIFCALAFCVAVLVIILAILAPMIFFTDTTSGEMIGVNVQNLENEVVQVTVMKGSSLSDLEYLSLLINGNKPVEYTAPESYAIGTTVYYKFPDEFKDQTGNLEIYAHFKSGNVERVYSETITLL